MRFRTPELIPLVFIAVSVTLLATLGIWQLERLEWKNALLAEIRSAQSQPALHTLPQTPEGLAYRNVTLSGRYLPQKTLHFIGRKMDGYMWLVPFQVENGTQTILVSTGWVASGMKEVALPATAAGILRPMRVPRLFSPENQPERNLWFSEDKTTMEAAIGLPLFPLILDTARLQPLRNDHLGYAITWFSLALVGIIMFIFYHRIPTKVA